MYDVFMECVGCMGSVECVWLVIWDSFQFSLSLVFMTNIIFEVYMVIHLLHINELCRFN